MTLVKKGADTIEAGIANLIAGANEDYMAWVVNDAMKKEFTEGWVVKTGPKYVKILSTSVKGGQASVWGFVVKGDNDKKFKKGDILKAAGWATPARNGARGNVLDGGYSINWTGPLYFK
tara:strand:- start:642 stop:998 length:357 start_codon:yes stop_codon:yes gene_type:complete